MSETPEFEPAELPSAEDDQAARNRGGSAALLVGAGILLSRIAGLIRERVFAHYFGNTATADAFKAALRIPNILQNLFGEGVLSASFIPVYATLTGRKQQKEADELANRVFGVLAAIVCLLVAAGVLATPLLVNLIAPGFAVEKRALTITLTRILFPATGLLVLSAWCLGILNSHGKFFLSYAAPVLWNVTIIAGLLWFAGSEQEPFATWVAWSVVAGSAAQLFVQFPAVLRCLGTFRPALGATDQFNREQSAAVAKNFVPVVVGRGVVQVSAYVDSLLASLLPTGAVAALSYMQTIYLLPIGLFGMSVSASELPALSQIGGMDDTAREALRKRLEGALRTVAYLIVPSVVAFVAIGDAIIGALFQTGKFSADDTHYVWLVLATGSIGLFWAAVGRLFSSAFFALRDTKTPLRCSLIRVCVAAGLGVPLSLYAPAALGIDPSFGLAGLVLGSAFGAIVEYYCLKSALVKKIGSLHFDGGLLGTFWAVAISAGVASRLAQGWLLRAGIPPIVQAIISAGIFGTLYLAGGIALKLPEAQRFKERLLRVARR